jgi:hypothetical protein
LFRNNYVADTGIPCALVDRFFQMASNALAAKIEEYVPATIPANITTAIPLKTLMPIRLLRL